MLALCSSEGKTAVGRHQLW